MDAVAIGAILTVVGSLIIIIYLAIKGWSLINKK